MSTDSSRIGQTIAHDAEFEQAEELDDRSRMGFLDHLDELRRRILYSLYAVLGCVAVTFWYWEPMFRYLVSYFRDNSAGGEVVYTNATAGFMFSLKVSGLAALVVASPFVFMQVWLFVAPGLYRREKRMAVPFVFFSSLLFFAGAAFAHYVGFPTMWRFLASYQIAGVKFLPQLDDTFGFYVYTLLGAGIVFQLPMLVFALARFGLVTAKFLARHFKYAVLVIFVLAAVITPSADVVSQTVIAAPMIVLYIVSIGVAWLFGKKRPADA
ncbi:MAG: twin-arginine translocase subunit TatC [Acidobacteria bacterium]|nr:twin-arginine translocase subunit TatC [Acidobacteriota bacterium]